eukprot:10136079-Heterocapsa_arctica.AAC.1
MVTARMPEDRSKTFKNMLKPSTTVNNLQAPLRTCVFSPFSDPFTPSCERHSALREACDGDGE